VKNKLIIALDVDSFEKAKELVDKLSPHAGIFKVGSELFTTCGPKIVEYINAKQKNVFLDLKFFDIPTTVKKAVLAAAKYKVFMLTLHIIGGSRMLKEAASSVERQKERPLLIGITVLTSKAEEDSAKEVMRLARIAEESALDGIVCSARETRSIKEAFGKKLLVVNPGIRPAWAGKDDQKRVATPEEAVKSGADFIVIGRPITQAKNPVEAVKEILKAL